MADFAQYLAGQAQTAVLNILSYLGAIIGAVWWLGVLFIGLVLLLNFLKSITGR